MNNEKLARAANMAISDLMSACNECNVHMQHRYYQSIKLLIIGLGKEQSYEEAWERMRHHDNGFRHPTWNELMHTEMDYFIKVWPTKFN
jgi:hypothetical protein